MTPEPHLSHDGDTMAIRLHANGIVAALDAIDIACLNHEPEWQFLRAELTRSPSRGQRVSIVLTLIRRQAVHRLHEERRASQSQKNAGRGKFA